MSQSADYYEHRLDEAQEREYALEETIAKLKDQIADLEDQNRKLMQDCQRLSIQLEGIAVSSPYHTT